MNSVLLRNVLVCIAGIFLGLSVACAEIIDKILVVVNDEVITQRDVFRKIAPFYEQLKTSYGEDEAAKRMESAYKTVVDQLVDDKLIVSEAKRRGIKVLENEIEDELARVKSRFKTDNEFYLVLDKQGISIDELKNSYKDSLIAKKLIDMEIGPKIQVTPIEAIRYYKKHVDEFTVPEVVKVRSILIRINERRSSEDALFLAKEIYGELKDVEAFKEMAIKYSDDMYASSGGDMGYVKKGQMMKRIDEALFNLKVGEYSDIIRTDLGYHIFLVEDKRPSQHSTFDQVKSRIEEIIFNTKIQGNLKGYVGTLKDKAFISYK